MPSITTPADANAVKCSDDDVYNGFCDPTTGKLTPSSVIAAIKASGMLEADPRVAPILKSLSSLNPSKPLSQSELLSVAADNLTLLHRIAVGELAIADFARFSQQLQNLKEIVEPDRSGANADYIPILKNADSEKFGVAFCSVDGQFFECGDTRLPFTIQSTSKPLTFALAMEKLGTEKVLQWCGIEPSGRPFNDITLLSDSRPYNPMVNSGAMMTAATLAHAFPDLAERDGPNGVEGTYGEELCEQTLTPLWQRLSGNGIVGDIGFCEETFLSERATADNNIGIAYTVKAKKGLPPGVNVNTMIDFYLRACSIKANTASMAVAAATLANGGRNPVTGDQVLGVDVVKKTLSVLSFCGFYDNAGEFFFHTGIPSKSGVSGVVFLVLPNVGGFAFFSPRLDKYGNSVRGSVFSKKLVDLFTFHSFDSLSSLSTGCKLDPRFSCDFSQKRNISRIRWALRAGGKQAQIFDELLIDVCLRVASIDGQIDETEVEALKRMYSSVMHCELSSKRIEEIRKRVSNSNGADGMEQVFQLVDKHERSLDDTEKQLLLEGAFKVVTADSSITEDERGILRSISKALKVDPLVTEIRLKEWQDQFGVEQE